jgi:prevent-host-death family protein
MARPIRPSTGAEAARQNLPAILDAAESGRTTVITRRGRAVAAVVPAARALAGRPASLLSLAGTGKGLWVRPAALTVATLRDEWER